MKYRIDIDKLFPPDVIANRQATLEAFWNGEDIGRPIIAAVPWKALANVETTAETYISVKASASSEPSSSVAKNIDSIIDAKIEALVAESRVPVDVIPKFGLGGGTVALASAFGGKVTVASNGKSWIEPIIDRADDAFKLALPDPTDGLVGTWIEYYETFSNSVSGHVPIGMPDMQGPLQTAAMLWGTERILYEMYDNPKAVHQSLKVVTEYIISISEYLRDTFPGARVESYPPAYLPQSHGQGLVEDFVQLLSPELYVEYGLPYVNRIAHRFGGIWLHCCATCIQHWPAFGKIHNLRGLDTMYPYTDPKQVIEAFPNIVHSIGLDYGESRRNFNSAGPDGWLEFLIDRIPRNVRWVFVTGCDEETTIPRQLELVNRRWR